MVKWGNNFEHLGCSQIFNNNRTNDWLINERYSDIYFGFASLLDYKDWSNNAFLGGQLHIFKNHYLLKGVGIIFFFGMKQKIMRFQNFTILKGMS